MAGELTAARDEMPEIHPHRLLRWMVFLTAVVAVTRLHLYNIEALNSPVLYRGLSFLPWLAALVADVRFNLPLESCLGPIGYIYFGLLLYLPVFKPARHVWGSALFVLTALAVHATLTFASLAAFGAILQV